MNEDDDPQMRFDATEIRLTDGLTAYLLAQAIMELRSISYDISLIAKKLEVDTE
jgi:hypothetical protein